MKKALISILITCLFSSCIQEFIPQGIEEVRGILVIDGMIRNGESVFKLSYSVGISDILDGNQVIDNAEIYVESDDETRIPALFAGNGTYIAQTPVLDAAKKYRLSALIDNEICESEYLAPIFTAEIDSIFPVKKSTDTPIEIFLATNDPDNKSIYYRWQYRETWEVKAELYANARWGPNIDDVIWHSLYNAENSENTYYCWGRDSSKTLLLASTEKLLENRISQQQLVTIPSDHDKLSILYHIEVEQMQIREAAYNYFSDLKKQTDRSGDIFDPIITTGLRGNISFRNDPDRVVIGYIEVATVTVKDRYLWDRIEGLYRPPIIICRNEYPYVVSWLDYPDYAIYSYGESRTLPSCVDCRLKEKSSKSRPSDWPSDHF